MQARRLRPGRSRLVTRQNAANLKRNVGRLAARRDGEVRKDRALDRETLRGAPRPVETVPPGFGRNRMTRGKRRQMRVVSATPLVSDASPYVVSAAGLTTAAAALTTAAPPKSAGARAAARSAQPAAPAPSGPAPQRRGQRATEAMKEPVDEPRQTRSVKPTPREPRPTTRAARPDPLPPVLVRPRSAIRSTGPAAARSGPRRLALCFGLNYTGSGAALRGCINDAVNLRGVLQARYGFEVTMMTDSTARKPTAANIRQAIRDLVAATSDPAVDEIFLSYSGHGSHVRDQSGDERDGQDETLVPLDYLRAGHIKDDELHQMLTSVRRDCRVVLLFDSCHSGSIVDLHYLYSAPNSMTLENPRSALQQKIVCLSGCTDSTTSADAYIAAARKFQGAMTTAFLQTLADKQYRLSCLDLLGGVQRMVRAAGHRQVPQLTSSFQLHVSNQFSGPEGLIRPR